MTAAIAAGRLRNGSIQRMSASSSVMNVLAVTLAAADEVQMRRR
jgi:hypothetical protein